MLAIVAAAKSVRASLKYNEQKVDQKQARLLDAHNFLPDKDQLTLRDKVQRFNDLTALNERSQKHSIHITLNFSPKDQLSDREMTHIATGFMERIGFSEQPWLTYRHIDAGHPHMHIVSTNIRPDGSRITNDLRSPAHLKQLCYALEEEYHLSPAIDMPDLFKEQQTPHKQKESEGETRVDYGKAPTKTQISRILDYVVDRYSYTDFESYNAILNEYHVRADRGREGSPMYNNKGLYYRVIDEDGKKLGAPIKASAFRQPATLPHLEERFRLNEAKVQEQAKSMRIRIDNCILFADESCSLGNLKRDMTRAGVNIVIDPSVNAKHRSHSPQPANNNEHGFFYIDHRAKIAVRDTDLGDSYTAAAVLRRTGIEEDIRRLANRNRFQLTIGERQILSQPAATNLAAPNPAGDNPSETLHLLIKLSARHDEIVDHKLDLIEQQRLSQRQGRGHGRSL